MTNSEEGKKILEVLRSVKEAHNKYMDLPSSNFKDSRGFSHIIQSLEDDHANLCCSICQRYNDECTCN